MTTPSADPTAPSQDAPSAGPQRLVLLVVAITLGGFATCAAYNLWPRGQRVGALDLTAPDPRLTVTVAAGSTLSFRLDTVVTAPFPSDSGRSLRNATCEALGASTIVLTDTLPGGQSVQARCPAYDGRFVSADSRGDVVAVDGIPVTCTLGPLSAGAHTLTARIAWARGLRARVATLEVRETRPR